MPGGLAPPNVYICKAQYEYVDDIDDICHAVMIVRTSQFKRAQASVRVDSYVMPAVQCMNERAFASCMRKYYIVLTQSQTS